MNRSVGRLVAENFFEERTARMVEEPRGERDLLARGAVVSEGSTESGARPEADTLREIGDAPERRPLFEERMERFDLKSIEFRHARID